MDVRAIDFPSVFTKEQLAYITKCVTDQARVVFGDTLRDVILYGSYARGDFGEWSDVDMMILADVDDLRGKRLESDLLKRLGDLNHHMNLLLSILVVPIDRFEYFKEYMPFYASVSREGVRLCSTNVR